MKVSNQKKNRRQQAFNKSAAAIRLEPTCRNCGERGAHFFPPCLGDPGFYMCEGKSND